MTNPIERFSNRVEDYVKYRPGYPIEILDPLRSECGLTVASVNADIGSGTGELSEIFLQNGNHVLAVEPNSAMRLAAERLLVNLKRFRSVNGSAESTTLQDNSVDFVTAGQAFHWFDQIKTRLEFERILKPGGWVVIIWNERRLDSTPFLRAYEELLLKYGTDYQQVRHENVIKEIAAFFQPETFALETFENVQRFDFESLKGRVFSASYTPEPGSANF